MRKNQLYKPAVNRPEIADQFKRTAKKFHNGLEINTKLLYVWIVYFSRITHHSAFKN